MARPAKVLDAWALVAWLRDQIPAAEAVEALLSQAKAGRVRLLVNIVNLGEVFYITAKRVCFVWAAEGPEDVQIVDYH